jgi:hypothetical protein
MFIPTNYQFLDKSIKKVENNCNLVMVEICLQQQVVKLFRFLIFTRTKLIQKKFIKGIKVKSVQFLGIKMILDLLVQVLME